MPRRDIEGSGARLAALRMLDAVLRRDETLEHATGFATKGLAPADAALAVAIAGETLRRLPDLDALIDSAMKMPLPGDAKARTVLRLALAQKIGLDTPDHAVVATALPLVDGGPRRLVHGVLSTLLKRDRLIGDEPPRLPDDVARRWFKAWGKDVVMAARRALVDRPPLDLSFKTEPEKFDGQKLAPLHRRLTEAGKVTSLPGFDAGDWWVQDLAASLPARCVPADAKRVLDAAAAPGGKAMQLAAAGYDVTALDRSKSRLRRLHENFARVGLKAEIVQSALEDYTPEAPFDAVLLDAPCSASGTIRRHPEVIYRARPAVIEQMAEVQTRLINAAAKLVRPGGHLIYATCSLEPQEGEEIVTAFLDRNGDFAVDPIALDIEEVAANEAGWLRIVPGMLEKVGGMDFFFICRLVRKG